MIALWLWTLGCSEPDSFAECAVLDGTAREDCRLKFAQQASEAELDLLLPTLGDPLTADLLLIRLAIDSPHRATELCARTRTEVGKQRCQQIIGRPHLRDGRG